MKTILFSVALMLAALGSSAKSGSITNIQVSQGAGDEERLITIQFDLTGSAAEYDISLEVSFDDGSTFYHIDPAKISSLSVAPDTGIQLVWDGRQTYGTVYAENTRIKITLTDWPRDTETEVVEVVSPVTGRTWMDRNLGAERVPESSTDEKGYGDLYQWGRAADGHQVVTRTGSTTADVTPITSTLSESDVPGHGDFIVSSEGEKWDWRSSQNDDLWQGVNGVNNPCPSGYRLPTKEEFEAETASWDSGDRIAQAFDSPLKLTFAGYRPANTGAFVYNYGGYWVSDVDGARSLHLNFDTGFLGLWSSSRTSGHSVRCIKN